MTDTLTKTERGGSRAIPRNTHMKTTHEYTITVTIPCSGDAEHQAEIFAKVRENYVALKAAAVEMQGAGTVAVVRKVKRAVKAAPEMAPVNVTVLSAGAELRSPSPLSVPAAKLAHG